MKIDIELDLKEEVINLLIWGMGLLILNSFALFITKTGHPHGFLLSGLCIGAFFGKINETLRMVCCTKPLGTYNDKN